MAWIKCLLKRNEENATDENKKSWEISMKETKKVTKIIRWGN
jgi:hypothetical protein